MLFHNLDLLRDLKRNNSQLLLILSWKSAANTCRAGRRARSPRRHWPRMT